MNRKTVLKVNYKYYVGLITKSIALFSDSVACRYTSYIPEYYTSIPPLFRHPEKWCVCIRLLVGLSSYLPE